MQLLSLLLPTAAALQTGLRVSAPTNARAAVSGLRMQEAMEALMDMLEKTITVEVRLAAAYASCRVARA